MQDEKQQVEPLPADIEDELLIKELEARLRSDKPPTFVSDAIEVWHLPHDPEQWIKVRKLKAGEVREYQAISARTSASINDPDRFSMELKAADAYFYLVSRCVVEASFKTDNETIHIKQKMHRDRVMNEDEYRRVFGDLDPLIAAWIERKLLVHNGLVPVRRR